MNTNVLLTFFGLELLGIIVFSVVVYVFFGLSYDKVKKNPERLAIRKRIRRYEHIVLWILTLLLLSWFIAQFVFFGATVVGTPHTIIISVLFVLACVVCYFATTLDTAMMIVFIQLILCLTFRDIGAITTYFPEQFVNTNKIEYCGHGYEPETVSKDKVEYFDFYYYTAKSECNGKKISFSSRYYSIDLRHDIEEDGQEYYEIFNRERVTKLEGIGFYYTAKAKPLVVIHVK